MRKEYIEDLEGEIWIQNNGYEISNKGRIITKQGKLSKSKIIENEYVSANVTFEDGFHAGSVHRAVAYAFIHNDDHINKIEVNHKDGIKHHNYVENLEWCTKSENQEHEVRVLKQRSGDNHYFNKINKEQVIEIYNLCKDREMKYKDIATMYGIFPQEVSDIALCIYWKGLNLEPLPAVTRGSRSMGKKVLWINKDKEYTSMSKCSDDLRNTYNIIISNKIIADICKGNLNEYKEQQFKYA
jgi:hypothetical protein